MNKLLESRKRAITWLRSRTEYFADRYAIIAEEAGEIFESYGEDGVPVRKKMVCAIETCCSILEGNLDSHDVSYDCITVGVHPTKGSDGIVSGYWTSITLEFKVLGWFGLDPQKDDMDE